MRENKYLENLLYNIWESSFCDIPRLNIVNIRYGRYSKRRLGSIKMVKDRGSFERYLKKLDVEEKSLENPSVSLITITKYFSDPLVPEYVIKSTIAHELCHYAHGFNSPLEKIYQHPHRGGVIKKELAKRDLLDLYIESNTWLKKNWFRFVS
jgi:hypothetical protein